MEDIEKFGKIATGEKEEAVAFIGQIMQQCQVLGSNDSEIPDLIRLRDEVLADKISPADARTKAQGIINSKQDYR